MLLMPVVVILIRPGNDFMSFGSYAKIAFGFWSIPCLC
uniref:Uncharacterized protein n=1 Tax=Rhizophora mucronata TaxID=61149 RepID=A0A2P2P5Q6_RHIMU